MYEVTIQSEKDKKKKDFVVRVKVIESGKIYSCPLTPAFGGYIFGIPFPSKGLIGEFTRNVHKSVKDWKDKLNSSDRCKLVEIREKS